ncbi:MAG: glycerol-3-phosphate dehydrogenase/oxidase [Pseudomonadota bacterium]
MKRRPEALSQELFDLVVIGGGMHGAACALDAAQRGLKVALLERGDFCGATSANSFKVVHGGMRYLQHADVARLRGSARARRAYLKIAPHLVRPLPILVPTYGRLGLKSKFALRTAFALYDALTPDRNRGISDPARKIPPGSFLSAREFKDLHPELATEALTGAGIFHDGQFINPPRLVLAFVRSAAALGAVIVNHMSAMELHRDGNAVTGVGAVDQITGQKWDIRTRWVVNAAGPYAEALLKDTLDIDLDPPGTYSRDAWFMVNRPLVGERQAVTVPGRSRDGDALASRGARHLFLVPWRGATLIGVWHKVYNGPPDDYTVTEEELKGWLDEVNEAYPSLSLKVEDVSRTHAGLVPFAHDGGNGSTLQFAHRSRFIDHADTQGVDGLTTVIGVRMTSAVPDAIEIVDLVQKRLQGRATDSVLERSALYGGDFDTFDTLLKEAVQRVPSHLSHHALEALVTSHGTAYTEVIDLIKAGSDGAEFLHGTHVLEAEIIQAVRNEMATTLTDVVFRRTVLCATAPPSDAALNRTAEIMAMELGWDSTRTRAEVAAVWECLAQPLSGRLLLAQVDSR